MKSQYTAIYQQVLIFWNAFARDHGYATIDALNSKLREKLKQRIGAERDYLHRMPRYFIRLLDGTRAYVHAVIDNLSRRILAWRVADTFAAINSVTVLLEAIEGATRSAHAPVVLALLSSRTFWTFACEFSSFLAATGDDFRHRRLRAE